MKQKYVISRNDEKNQLVIKEYAELDKEIFSFLCEATYDAEIIRAKMAEGKDALISELRTENMYPPNLYADQLADTVKLMFQSDDFELQTEVFFDDIELLGKDQEIGETEKAADDDSEDIDDILNEDLDDSEDIKLKSPLKIADDENGEADEDH
jgi:hypothetical protein